MLEPSTKVYFLFVTKQRKFLGEKVPLEEIFIVRKNEQKTVHPMLTLFSPCPLLSRYHALH